MALDITVLLKRIVLPNGETVPRRKLASQFKNGRSPISLSASSFSLPSDWSPESSSLLDESYLRMPISSSSSSASSLSFALQMIQLAQGRPNPLVALQNLCGIERKAAFRLLPW